MPEKKLEFKHLKDIKNKITNIEMGEQIEKKFGSLFAREARHNKNQLLIMSKLFGKNETIHKMMLEIFKVKPKTQIVFEKAIQNALGKMEGTEKEKLKKLADNIKVFIDKRDCSHA